MQLTEKETHQITAMFSAPIVGDPVRILQRCLILIKLE